MLRTEAEVKQYSTNQVIHIFQHFAYHVEFTSKMAPILPYEVSHVFHPNNMSAIQLLLLRSTDKTQTTITTIYIIIRCKIISLSPYLYQANLTEFVLLCNSLLQGPPYQLCSLPSSQ